MKSISDKEKELLDIWEEQKIFERSVHERPSDRLFTFYDGPPFATGLPHYGHIIASLMKDVVPRYWTMKGYRVERVWGWDCHGLPIENIIEEKLKLKTKKDIENYGVANFNEQCRSTVLEYAQDWKKTIRRMGRWVDMEGAYMTMSPSYMESVWWVFAELWKKGLVYEGKKAMHLCPRCATPLSNFEVTLGYKDISDIAATVKFHLTSGQEFGGRKYKTKDAVYILAWTTTPWTLPGNVALAVGGDIKYTSLRLAGTSELLIVASDRVDTIFKDKEVEIVHDDMTGADLVGLHYEPLFPYFKDTQNAFKVVAADFVSTHEGTGVVHIAPAFGEDDYELGKREDIGFVQHVTQEGVFTQDVTDFAGKQVKPKEDSSRTDFEIVDWLGKNNKLFSKEKYLHSYPHCWRCDTPLLNYATSSWFIQVTELKEELLANNAKTTWIPEHMRDGRFGMWLSNARDWAVSRNRYWGTSLPIWKSEDGDVICVGSISELEALSGQTLNDLHKHIVDSVTFEKNGKTYRRTEEVFDCWFESGAMPYAQHHYPFENKEKFEQGFPAQFIAEGQDQTRGWFYTLHVLATALTRGEKPSIPTAGSAPAFLNVIVNGIVLAADGKKMAKRLKNYPDPLDVMERYGADAMRYYFVTSPAMYAENLNFNEQGVREVYNKIVNTLENALAFYQLFGCFQGEEKKPSHILDRWIMSKCAKLVNVVTEEMEAYRLSGASRPFIDFVADLSQWYIRRSRDRFKSEDVDEKEYAHATLHTVLVTLSKLIAPFMPFLAERMYMVVMPQHVSVHLEVWPSPMNVFLNENVEQSMEQVQKIVELGHSLRAEGNMKVRQPLAEFHCSSKLSQEYYEIIADELNVKRVTSCVLADHEGEWKEKHDGEYKVHMCFSLTKELHEEGLIRELTRLINAKRKTLGLTMSDSINVVYVTDDKELQSTIAHLRDSFAKSILASSIQEGAVDEMEEMNIGSSMIKIAIQKIQP